MEKLKKKVAQAFKLSGYVIRSENSTFLAEQLFPFEPSEHDKWLTTVIENIQNLKLDSTNIDRSVIEKAIGEINRVGLQDHETVFSVIDAFEIPRFNYNTLTKKFELDKTPRSILAEVDMKIRYLRYRYDMLYQKTIRHELFSPSILQKSSEDQAKKFKLYHAENLLASSEVKEAVILGQLNQIEEGKFFIEDPTGYVEVDLSEARYHSGFFCEGSFVLAEGSYENKIFKVDGLGFPPAEPASSSRAFFGTANSWGGPSEKLLKYSVALQEVERTNTEATMVFLSDVELDIPIVLDKLRKLFVGYDSCPPICIVLMGPFATTIHNYYELVPLFKKLAEAANGCDQLKKETDLIIVPHADDPVQSDILPRMSIPDVICEDLLKAWPRTRLASNPCRLQYCTQQIVVFRMDLMAKLARNSIHFPDTKTIDNHFARTLICQGHLTPLERFVNPIYWDFDAAMWLYPLPDLVVIGDSCHSFSITQHGCTILNTGSFPRSKYSFKMYIPSMRTIEDSEIPDGFGEDDDRNKESEQHEEVVEIPEEYDESNRIIQDEDLPDNLPSDHEDEEAGESEIVDDSNEPGVSPYSVRATSVIDPNKPGVSGLSREMAKKLLEQSMGVPSKDSDDEDFDLPGPSGIRRGEAYTTLSTSPRDEETQRLIQQLELPSESDSDDE